jgi:hypothetical protein
LRSIDQWISIFFEVHKEDPRTKIAELMKEVVERHNIAQDTDNEEEIKHCDELICKLHDLRRGIYRLVKGEPDELRSGFVKKHNLAMLHVVHHGISTLIVLLENKDQVEQMDNGVDKYVEAHAAKFRSKFQLEVLRCDRKRIEANPEEYVKAPQRRDSETDAGAGQ